MSGQGLVKPVAEFHVEGELSPFEQERIFQILKKRFLVSQPDYVELPDENLVTRVTITFRYPYNSNFFAQVFMEGWRDLKDILREVRYRRGGAGAAFNLVFIDIYTSIKFMTGLLDSYQLGSALDQIGHLTSILRKIIEFGTGGEALDRVECVFDGLSDRWQALRGYGSTTGSSYRFDERDSIWVPSLIPGK